MLPLAVMGQAKSDSLTHALKGTEDTSEVKTLNLLSWEFSKAGYFEKGMEVCRKALEIAKKLKFKKGEAGAWNNMGSLYSTQADYPKALKNYLTALKVAEESGNKKQIVACYNNIGINYQKQKDYKKALEYHLKSLHLKEQMKDKKGIANSLTNIGNVYNIQQQYDEALKYYKRSMPIAKELSMEHLIASNLNNMGYVFLSKKEYDESASLFTQAQELSKKLGDKENLLMAMENLGDIAKLQGLMVPGAQRASNFRLAERYFIDALAIAKEVGDRSFIKDSYKGLSYLYVDMHDPRRALENYKLFIAYRDSMFNEENTKASLLAEMNYEYEKKEALIRADREKKEAVAIEERENERQRNFILLISVIAGLAIASGFAIIMVRAYHQKKKANQFIEEKKREVELQKTIIENKQKEILDSIHYARRIQSALLTPEKYIDKTLARHRK